MPPSARRPQRAKREAPVADDIIQSSPSRPSKKRRTKQKEEPEPVEVKLPTSQAELDMNDMDLVCAVAQHLLMPKHEVQVAIDHDNETQQMKAGDVAAYAKITGKDWTYYVQSVTTNIGRPPEALRPSEDASSAPPAPEESKKIHIDLGPSKVVSRLHAEICYVGDDETWKIKVNGRNHIKVNEQAVHRGKECRLRSGNVVEIAGVEMMFVLPGSQDKLSIAPKYLRRAGLIEEETPSGDADLTEPEQTKPRPSSSLGPLTRPQPSSSGQLPIAPAPPNYTRPDTPLRHNGRGLTAKSPYGPSGTMMMASDQIDQLDLRADENADVKPNYTYSQLISQALLQDPNQKQTLNAIYKYCENNYAYYRRKEKGWQNSIRHNLSLNNGFILKPRESHEPGKGGYWVFQEDRRQDLINDAWGGRPRRSPRRASGKSSSPRNSPGKNDEKIGRQGDMNGASTSKLKRSSKESQSPLLNSYPHIPQFTPDRGNTLPLSMQDPHPGDGSPLPRRGRTTNSSFGGTGALDGSPPILSSSFAVEDVNGSALVTPAPVRKHPYLAPPSTAQRPSQHMPTSSPAPFWRYVDMATDTPIRPYDVSPTKETGGIVGMPHSSSPPPRRGSGASPSRSANASKLGMSGRAGIPVKEPVKVEVPEVEDVEEEPSFDLTKGFIGIGKYHAQGLNGQA